MTRGDKGKLFILFVPSFTLSLLSKIVWSLWYNKDHGILRFVTLMFHSVPCICLWLWLDWHNGLYRGKSAYEPRGSPGRSWSRFLKFEVTRNFYYPLHVMQVYYRVTPRIKFAGTHFVQLGGERHCESKASCSRIQHNNCFGQGSNPDHLMGSRSH